MFCTFGVGLRRLARRCRGIEPCKTIRISLHGDSKTVARGTADRARRRMVEARDNAMEEVRYKAARDTARERGFRVLDAGDVAMLTAR